MALAHLTGTSFHFYRQIAPEAVPDWGEIKAKGYPTASLPRYTGKDQG